MEENKWYPAKNIFYDLFFQFIYFLLEITWIRDTRLTYFTIQLQPEYVLIDYSES